MVDDAREALRRAAYGRPPEFADDAAARAWEADAQRARAALSEPPAEVPGVDAGRAVVRVPLLARPRIRNAALVAVAAVAAAAAGTAWLATPRYPDPLPGNELPAGYAEQFGLDRVQNLVNWRDWSVMVAGSRDDPDVQCLIFARDGGHGFTCRAGVLRHDMFAGERADLVWDPATGLTITADDETIVVPYRLPAP